MCRIYQLKIINLLPDQLIEKECLAVVFGVERFDQYTYGR